MLFYVGLCSVIPCGELEEAIVYNQIHNGCVVMAVIAIVFVSLEVYCCVRVLQYCSTRTRTKLAKSLLRISKPF